MTLNQHFLKKLCEASCTQVSPKVLAMCRAVNANDPNAIKQLFSRIYKMGQEDRSLFVASMVNPLWTHQRAYSMEHKA